MGKVVILNNSFWKNTMSSKIVGVTFEQLHSLSPEELAEVQIKFMMENMARNLAIHGVNMSALNEGNPTYCKVKDIVKSCFDSKHYSIMRVLYDTPEKFELGAEMVERTEKIAPVIGTVMAELSMMLISTELESSEGQSLNLQ